MPAGVRQAQQRFDMQAKAVTKYVRISPTKVRPVMDLVRGKPVDRALAILRHLPHKAAREIARTIESARGECHQQLRYGARCAYREVHFRR